MPCSKRDKAKANTGFSKQMLLGMCKAAIGQANINAQEMQNIGLYLPSIELQRQFVQFKEQTDKSKLAIQQSLDKLELLKKSLLAFFFPDISKKLPESI